MDNEKQDILNHFFNYQNNAAQQLPDQGFYQQATVTQLVQEKMLASQY